MAKKNAPRGLPPMYVATEVSFAKLSAANMKHDSSQHIVCMWQRARYDGSFGYPPSHEKSKRKQVRRFLDGDGNIQVTLA